MTTQNFGLHVMLAIEGVVARLVIDRPLLNLLSRALVIDLQAALVHIEALRDVRVMILAAGGQRAFIAGVDVNCGAKAVSLPVDGLNDEPQHPARNRRVYVGIYIQGAIGRDASFQRQAAAQLVIDISLPIGLLA